jgi:two-component system, response regulator RegA
MRQSDKGTLRILLVDDDKLWSVALSRGLRSLGVAVEVACSAREFLERSGRAKVDAIVMDLNLPDGTGLSLLPRVRAAHPTATIVICTGYGSIAACVDALRNGANDFVTKPISCESLLMAITAASSASGEARQVGCRPMTLERVQWEHIQRVLMDSGWNLSEAARRLGIHRQSLQRKLRKFPVLRE